MYYLKKKGTWFGMLQSSKGDAVMIWDSILPTASTGKVFLYNTRKDSLIEYVEELVRPKLRDLSKDELHDAQSEFGDRWSDVRAQFESVEEEEDEPETVPEVKGEIIDLDSIVEDDDIFIDDDFEDV